MSGNAVELALASERLVLLPGRAAWLPDRSMLLVADIHIGKAVSFRRLGVPVPRGTTSANLDALTALLEQTAAQRLVVLGDFLHSPRAHAASTLAALARWRQRHAALALTLVRGNHDARAGDPPPALGIEVVDEPLRVGDLALSHHPRPVAGAYVLAGHWHPCVHFGGRAHDRLRLPCFWFGDPDQRAVGVLPAFGDFTGMHPIAREAGDRIWAVAEDRVVALP